MRSFRKSIWNQHRKTQICDHNLCVNSNMLRAPANGSIQPSSFKHAKRKSRICETPPSSAALFSSGVAGDTFEFAHGIPQAMDQRPTLHTLNAELYTTDSEFYVPLLRTRRYSHKSLIADVVTSTTILQPLSCTTRHVYQHSIRK